MRATEDLQDFAAWLLRVSNGMAATEPLPKDDIEVPQETCVQGSLVDKHFNSATQEEYRNQVIHSPKN